MDTMRTKFDGEIKGDKFPLALAVLYTVAGGALLAFLGYYKDPVLVPLLILYFLSRMDTTTCPVPLEHSLRLDAWLHLASTLLLLVGMILLAGHRGPVSNAITALILAAAVIAAVWRFGVVYYGAFQTVQVREDDTPRCPEYALALLNFVFPALCGTTLMLYVLVKVGPRESWRRCAVLAAHAAPAVDELLGRHAAAEEKRRAEEEKRRAEEAQRRAEEAARRAERVELARRVRLAVRKGGHPAWRRSIDALGETQWYRTLGGLLDLPPSFE